MVTKETFMGPRGVLQVTQSYFTCCCSKSFHTVITTLYRGLVLIFLIIFFSLDYFYPRSELPSKVDYVDYVLKPTNWISALTIIWLSLLIAGEMRNRSVGVTHRPDNEPLTSDHTLLRILAHSSNLYAVLVPSSILVMIYYYDKFRFDLLYFDVLYEMAMVCSFVILGLETIFGLHYVSYGQLIWVSILFILVLGYIAALGYYFKVDMYTWLDWVKEPKMAFQNSVQMFLVFVLVQLMFVSGVLGKKRLLGYQWFLQPPQTTSEILKEFDGGV